ncbi:hypothetical protein DSO57_1039521 [Entomophthora muscae]|uniref:Uncharacterized protein n=1 Tax=Entomophthora muscae TaxID=34485 RepID=A0ACC2SBE7_9FUNG|nr:hypothetical protein DSO57_1039521 [Entomophthora muscae]
MGKTLELTPEQQLVQKFRSLFELTMNKLDTTGFTFEDFIDSFDETDVFICRLFEFVVKDAGQKHKKKTLPQGDNAAEDLSDPVSLRDVLINFRRRHSIFPSDYGLPQHRPAAVEPSPLPFNSFPSSIPLAPLTFTDYSNNELSGLNDSVINPQVNPSSPGLISNYNGISPFPLHTRDSYTSRSNSIGEHNVVNPYHTPLEWFQNHEEPETRTPEMPENYFSASLASLGIPQGRRSSVPHFVRQHHLDAVRRLSLLRNHPYSSLNNPRRSRNFYPPSQSAFLPEFNINASSVGLVDPASGTAELGSGQASLFPFDPHHDTHEL